MLLVILHLYFKYEILLMRLELDNESDAAFIYFKEILPNKVAKTISLNENINVDLDSKGRILGMEILNASKTIPLQPDNSKN